MDTLIAESSTIESRDGTRLRMLSYPEPESPKARILFVHGWASHAARGALPAEWFVSRGYAWHAIDYRGHGLSDGPRGFVADFDRYLEDVDAFIKAVFPEDDGVPTFLIGHSHGGLICGRFIEQHPTAARLSGVVFSSPFFGLKLKVPWIKRFVAERLARLIPKASVDAGQLPVTRNEEVQQAYLEDPLSFSKAPFGWVAAATDAQHKVLHQAGKMRQPVLFLHGGADEIADPETTQAVHEACGSPDKTLTVYDGFYHEIFNEPQADREQVFADVEAWFEGQLG